MIRVIAVGRLRQGPEAALYERYTARLRRRPVLTEITEAKGSPAEIKRREGAALLAALPDRAFAVALDLGGAPSDTDGFAALLQRWTESGRPVCFLIGGAEGLDGAVLARANHALSLGRMTWPHFLVRALLAEQLFRVEAMASGHPYHRAGRPG